MNSHKDLLVEVKEHFTTILPKRPRDPVWYGRREDLLRRAVSMANQRRVVVAKARREFQSETFAS